jgi:uncharacterized membrane protein YbaN (DUF454 family)|tara:strand:- start:12 stop:431 length:420 start_codon:yes stop_codon:yes gene_type:complete
MNKIKKAFWLTLGVLLVGVAYLGVLIPGLPWSTPILGATFCFAKSSPRFHAWIMNHPRFGPFIKNWSTYRVYPTAAKYLMVAVMTSSLVVFFLTVANVKATIYMGITFALIIGWATRYPGSRAEAERRIKAGEKIGWLK